MMQRQNSVFMANRITEQSDIKQLFSKQFLFLFFGAFLYMVSVTMPGPIIASFCAKLGGSGTLMGISVGVFNVTSLLTRPLAGNATDRYDRRFLAFLGLSAMALGAFGVAISSGVMPVILFRMLGGAGFAFSSVAFSTCVAASAPEGKVGSAIGFYSMLQALGMAIGPTMGLQLSEYLGYRGAFTAAGLIALLGIAVAVGCGRMPAPDRGPACKSGLLSVEVLPVSFVVMLITIPNTAVSSFLKTIVLDRGLDLNVGWYFTFSAVFMLALRTVLSKFFDTWPYRTFALIGIPTMIAALGMLQLARYPWQLLLAALLTACSYGIILPVSQATSVRLVGKEHQGQANSTYYIGMDLGLTFGALIAGNIYEHMGGEWMFPFMMGFPLLIYIILGMFHRKLEPQKDNNGRRTTL